MQITKLVYTLFLVSFLTEIYHKEGDGAKFKVNIFMGVSLFHVNRVLTQKCRKGGIMQALYATPATDCNADRSCQKKV